MNPGILEALKQHGWVIHMTDAQTYIQFVQKAGSPTLPWAAARDLVTLAGYTVYDPKIPRPLYLHVCI